MIERLAATFHAELSPDNALRHAREVNNLERRYSYDNFRKSAQYCANVLKDIGAEDVELIPYPADGVTTYLDCVMPMAWDVKGARLEIVAPQDATPRLLVDWEQDPFTIGMWSPPTKPEGDEAEIVTIEDMRAGADVRGKIVLNATTHHPRTIKLEVAQRGAIGVVSDWTENYLDTPDGIYWNNEWSQSAGGWYGGTKEDAEDSPIWCLSITPRTGAYLRKLMSGSDAPVRLRAFIDTRLYEGTLDVVTGVIPGKRPDAGQALMMAHIYEPMPIDDAAGAGAVLEIFRTIKTLIDRGDLPQPDRDIRLLFYQERFGSSAYFATHEDARSRTVAAFNMDEPCFDPRLGGTPIRVGHSPDLQASFTDVLITDIAQHCFATYAPLLPWQLHTGTGGSDTFIVDPTIGIPIIWTREPTGRHHHSSTSSFSYLDPVFLHVNLTMNAAYTYFVASAGRPEAVWLGSRIVTEARKKMIDEVEKQLAPSLDAKDPDFHAAMANIQRRLDYRTFIETNRVASLRRIVDPAKNPIAPLSQQIADMASACVEMAQRDIQALRPDYQKPASPPAKPLTETERAAQNIIPTRIEMGPPVQYAKVPKDARMALYKKADLRSVMWVDGKRDLLEIIRLIENARDIRVTDIDKYISYFTDLAKYGYIEIQYRNDCA